MKYNFAVNKHLSKGLVNGILEETAGKALSAGSVRKALFYFEKKHFNSLGATKVGTYVNQYTNIEEDVFILSSPIPIPIQEKEIHYIDRFAKPSKYEPTYYLAAPVFVKRTGNTRIIIIPSDVIGQGYDLDNGGVREKPLSLDEYIKWLSGNTGQEQKTAEQTN